MTLRKIFEIIQVGIIGTILLILIFTRTGVIPPQGDHLVLLVCIALGIAFGLAFFEYYEG